MRKLFQSPQIILFGIFVLAAYFRFNNLNWDSNFHLHPDERFLTMVGNAMQIPSTIFEYFNPAISKLNPVNINFPFFIYGTFPIVLNKLLAVVSGNDHYNGFTILGRFLSGFFDILTVVIVYKTAKILTSNRHPEFISGSDSKKQMLNPFDKTQGKQVQHDGRSSVPIWSAFFYATSVLPIQLSHFFAVDTFLNFFMFTSFYFALNYFYLIKNHDSKFYLPLFMSAIFFGLALATKITAIFILPLNLFFILVPLMSRLKIKKIILFSIFYFLFSYFTLRLADPYIFESANVFDPRPNKIFIENLQSLKSFEGKDIWYPPGIQWISKNPTFALVNLALYGLGLPYFVMVIIGIVWIISKLKVQISKPQLNNQKFPIQITNYQLPITLLWTAGFFIYQSFQFVKAMRYFIFIYPFLAIFAAFGVNVILNLFQDLLFKKQMLNPFDKTQGKQVQHDKKTTKKIFLTTIYLLLTTILLIWPFAFSSIYTSKVSRIAASEWIYENIPDGSFILSEHWDDALPLSLDRRKHYTIRELPVFGPDDKQKWIQMNELLGGADYYILSSNRGWGSIPTVPEKYPKMAKFYADLLANRLNYKKIKEFASYPKLEIGNWKLEISDEVADESFTVYDHPKVLIFQKQ